MMQVFKKILKTIFKIVVFIVLIIVIVLFLFRMFAGFREEYLSHEIVPYTGQYISIGEEQIYIQTYGKTSAQPLLLVHGTAAWSGLWQETAIFLAKHGYRVYALDLPPFGFSNRPKKSNYSRVDQAERIIKLLKALHLKDTIIIGHSFGSGAAVEAVMQDGALFSGLVLIDAALNLNTKEKNTELPLFLQNSYMRELIVSTTITNPFMTKFLLQTLLYKKDINLERYVDILQRPMQIKGSTNAISQWLPFLLLDETKALSSNREGYTVLHLPTRLIWGEKDSVTPLIQGKELHQLIPHSILNVLDEVGHIPQIENPEGLQRSLLFSLKSIENTQY